MTTEIRLKIWKYVHIKQKKGLTEGRIHTKIDEFEEDEIVTNNGSEQLEKTTIHLHLVILKVCYSIGVRSY